MTNVTSRTITSRRREWIVPAAQPWGACLGDMRDGIAIASAAYRLDHDLGTEAALADDALRFHVTDDEIVISYVIENDERAQRVQAAPKPSNVPEPQLAPEKPSDARTARQETP